MIRLIFFLSILTPIFAHTSEVNLDQIIKKSTLEHLEVKEGIASLIASESSFAKTKSAFYPEVGLEGGFEGNQSPAQRSSNTFGFIYGKYNIFNGGKDLSAKASANLLTDYERTMLTARKTKSVREVTSLFYEILALQDAQSIHDNFYNLNLNHLEMAKKKANSGVTTGTDVIEFELRNQEFATEIELTKNDLKSKINELNAMINSNYSFDQVKFSGSFKVESLQTPTNEWFVRQELTNPEQLLNAKNGAVIASEVNYLFAEYLPRLSLNAQYGKLSNDFALYNRKSELAFKATLTIPLFTGFSTSSTMEEKVDQKRVFDLRENKLRREIQSNAWSDFYLSEQLSNQIKLLEKSLVKIKTYQELTLMEYKKGVKNSPDLASATDRYHHSKLKLIDLQKRLSIIHAKYLLPE